MDVNISWLIDRDNGRIKIDKNDLLLALYCAKEKKVSLDEIIENIHKTGMSEEGVIKVL